MIDKRVIIFGHSRSGSTSLFWAINMHPLMQMLLEPFHEKRDSWGEMCKNYRKGIFSIDDLKTTLNEIYRDYNGFKTLSYQLPKHYNEYVLREMREGKDKIVLIHRKNLLQAVVSSQISLQTNLWNVAERLIEVKDRGIVRSKIKQHMFHTVDSSVIREHLEEHRATGTHYKNFLIENNKTFLELTYEELFLSSRRERLKQIRTIFEYLELFLPHGEFMERVANRFDPKGKINDAHTYGCLPNIMEIEREFACEKNGSVFESFAGA